MKKAGLFLTIGTRDLQLKEKNEALDLQYHEETDSYSLKNPRSIGSFLNKSDQPKALLDFLQYPIIKPAIDYVIKQGFQINWIVFVVTNQVDAPEKFNKFDTFFYGILLEQLIKRDYSTYLSANSEFVNLPVERSIVYLDSMYDFFNDYFKKDNHFKAFQDTDKIFYLGQGGVDALNTGLLLNLIEYFPNLVQLQKSSGSELAIPLVFTDKFRKGLRIKQYINSISQALKQYDYSLSKTIVNKGSVEFYLSVFALSRIHLDFSSAINHLQQLYILDLNNRDKLMEWEQEITSTNAGFNIQKELFMSAMIQFKQGAYSDYLWRLFTLEENLLKPQLEQKLNGKIEYNTKTNHASWAMLIEKNEELKKYLTDLHIGPGFKLNYSTPNRVVFRQIYNYYFPENSADRPENMTRILDSLSALSGLRNDIAHSMKGIALDEINKKLLGKAEDLNSLLYDYFELENEKLPPYDSINEMIRNEVIK
ncbi:MAG: hypothetical protein IPO63_17645 [Bacteroidetes bacterium]|nr:hypothetical protein [Bacteroidota bacterium]